MIDIKKNHPLKEWMDRKNIKYGDFALAIPLGRVRFSQIINCISYPSMPVAQKIVQITNGDVSFEDLLTVDVKREFIRGALKSNGKPIDLRRKKRREKKSKKE